METDRIRILLVEDNQTDIKLLRKTLSQRAHPCFTVKVAETLEEGIERVQKEPLDVVLLDLNLPDSDGVATLERFQTVVTTLPIIILTGHNDRDFAISTLAMGAQDYLIKGQVDAELLSRVLLYAIERKQIQNQLREDEMKIRLFVEHSPAAIAIFDRDMRYLMTSQRWLEDYNIKKEETIGQYHYDVIQQISEKWKQKHKKCLTGQIEKSEEDLIIFPDGRREWIRWEMHPWRLSNEEIGGIIIFREIITQRKQAEEELIRYKNELETRVNRRTQELKDLYSHLEEVRENERKGIAREVHDELGQALTALKMDVSWMDKHTQDDQNNLKEKLQGMSELLSATIKSVQRICSQLRPGILDDLGLVAAIEWQIEDFQNRSGLKCHATINIQDEHLDPKYATTIFRVFQETLTNILRHAQASEIQITLVHDATGISFEIRDNGVGIEPEALHRSDAFGLIGMRERVNLINGEFHITGQPGQGTTIKIQIPIPNKGMLHA